MELLGLNCLYNGKLLRKCNGFWRQSRFKKVSDGEIKIAAPTILTSKSANFTKRDEGKVINIEGGAGPPMLSTTIKRFVNSTQVELADAATTTVSSAKVRWGTKEVSDGEIAACMKTLTSESANFTKSDEGKVINVEGAGHAISLSTTIKAVNNPEEVVLNTRHPPVFLRKILVGELMIPYLFRKPLILVPV